jgi:hypothetical protein
MKRILLAVILGAFLLLIANQSAQAGEVDVLVNKLIEKGVLSPAEGQIILDETKVQVSKDLATQSSYSVPEWTQRIKASGDIRFRTQYDSGKGVGTTTESPNGGAVIKDQRWRERVRARIGLEGKVNDFTYAGVRVMGGDVNSNTGNDTLDKYFAKKPVEWDQYWIRFEAPQDIIKRYGQYFNDAKIWLGKFPNPFETTDLVWDNNINPGGAAYQVVGPDVKLGPIPTFNIYSNGGEFVLDESSTINTDPMLFAMQIGAKTVPFGPFNSTFNVAGAIYNFENLQNKTPTVNSAGTNSRVWRGNDDNAGGTVLGSYKYQYDVLDLLFNLDNGKFLDWDLPNGLYIDLIHNPAAVENNGMLFGGYIGKKKPKEKNDWKIRAEYRYLERDALPDFMTDNDWYGFGTQTSTTAATVGGIGAQNNNGYPAQNGTNGKGIVLASEYMIFKNTSLNLKYSWMKPIESDNKTDPWNEFMFDVLTKF